MLLAAEDRALPRSVSSPWRATFRQDAHVPHKPSIFHVYDVERDPGEQRDIAAQHPALLEELKLLLERLQGSSPARVPEGEQVDPDPELRKRLEALGYLE